MKLVSGRCPSCGANLQLDESMEKGFCMYCGSQFQVRDAVQMLKVEHSGSVQLKGVASDESLVKRGYMAIENMDLYNANKSFEDALRINPDNYNAWKGLFIVCATETQRLGKHWMGEFAGNAGKRYGYEKTACGDYYLSAVFCSANDYNYGSRGPFLRFGLSNFDHQKGVAALNNAIKLAPVEKKHELQEIKEYNVDRHLRKIQEINNWAKQRLCVYCGGKISFFDKCKTCSVKHLSKPMFERVVPVKINF